MLGGGGGGGNSVAGVASAAAGGGGGGSSSQFSIIFPAALLPCRAPESAMTVEVNLANTSMSDFYKHHMRGTASDMLAQMM